MSRILKGAATLTLTAALACPIVLPGAAIGQPTRPGATPPDRGSTLPTPGATPNGAPVNPAVPIVPESGSTLPVPPEATAPEIDAAAEALIQQASTSYKALTSLSELIEVTANVPGEKSQNMRIRVYYQRPNKALVQMSDEAGTSTIAADGRTVSLMVPQVKGKYMQRPLPEPANPIEVALQRTAGVGPGLDLWLSGGDILAQIRPVLSSLKLGAPEQIEGVDVESAVLSLKSRSGPVTMTFSFGKNDHLVRRVRMERTLQDPQGKETKMTMTELHREVQPNAVIAANSIKFTPPAGYKKVDSLEPPTYDEKLVVGGAPYAINTKDLSGKALNLAQYKGKVVLLDFWATWCGPCMMELPALQAVHKKYKGQGFDVIGISSDESKGDLQSVIKARSISWRQVFDGAEGPINARYKVVAIPTSFLIGRDGKIAAINLRGPELEPAIKKALAQKASAQKAPAKSGNKVKSNSAKAAVRG